MLELSSKCRVQGIDKKNLRIWNYQTRRFLKLWVNFNNLTRDWGVDITGCFHTLHCSKALTLRNWTTWFWQIHKHHFSQMILWRCMKTKCFNPNLNTKYKCKVSKMKWCKSCYNKSLNQFPWQEGVTAKGIV